MQIKQYQVDAFTRQLFGGNPAAVCPLEYWLEDSLLQAIAEENNLSETAFFVPTGQTFQLRWFTPTREVDLCGHATLASAHIIFEILGYRDAQITFETRSGNLSVERHKGQLVMNFPAYNPVSCPAPEILLQALGQHPVDSLMAEDFIAVFDSEATVRAITPNHELLKQLDYRGVIITAAGTDVDFVSRFFAPKLGIAEDPVTGAAHCELAPYWGKKLGKDKLSARQISKRGGDILCQLHKDRVLLSGSAVTFMEAVINIPV